MNPKLNPLYTIEEKEIPMSDDYPRFTSSMKEILKGISKFRETISAWRN